MGRSAKVLQRVQPYLPGTTLCRDILVVGPTNFILRGFFLNATPQKHHMDLWSVVTPLYRPLDSITLTYGNVIGLPGNTRVKVDDLNRAAEVVEKCARLEVGTLRALKSPTQFLRHIAWRSGAESEIVQLDFALTHFLIGNVSEALRRLRLLMMRHDSFPVHRKVVEQALDALDDRSSALLELMHGWRDANVAAFGLETAVLNRPQLRLLSPSAP